MIVTDTITKRGKQLDKVYDYWQKAYDAYAMVGVTLDSGPTTKWLKKLRDYLNKEFPDDKRKSHRTPARPS